MPGNIFKTLASDKYIKNSPIKIRIYEILKNWNKHIWNELQKKSNYQIVLFKY